MGCRHQPKKESCRHLKMIMAPSLTFFAGYDPDLMLNFYTLDTTVLISVLPLTIYAWSVSP